MSWLSGAEVLCASGRGCYSPLAVLAAAVAAAESRADHARLPVCRVSWAKQTPS